MFDRQDSFCSPWLAYGSRPVYMIGSSWGYPFGFVTIAHTRQALFTKLLGFPQKILGIIQVRDNWMLSYFGE